MEQETPTVSSQSNQINKVNLSPSQMEKYKPYYKWFFLLIPLYYVWTWYSSLDFSKLLVPLFLSALSIFVFLCLHKSSQKLAIIGSFVVFPFFILGISGLLFISFGLMVATTEKIDSAQVSLLNVVLGLVYLIGMSFLFVSPAVLGFVALVYRTIQLKSKPTVS